jgi:hypothetical protein
MNNKLFIFDRIIRGDLRPWLDENRDEDNFATSICDLKLVAPQFQVVYEIGFYPFFSNKTRYYHKLIMNEANNYCNNVINLINLDGDTRTIEWLLGDTLKKKLRTLLKDNAKLIKANDWHLKYINPYQSSFNTDLDHKTNTYIVQLLKTATIKVYLEIQEIFKFFITSDDYMGIEILYLQYLSEPIPEETFLKRLKISEIALVEIKSAITLIDKVSIFKPKSFKFDRLSTNPGALNDLFDSLILHLFIAKWSSIRDFKKVFSGKEIINPIRWTGNDSEFYWFIYLIYTRYKFVEDLRQQQWKVACQCFVKADGTQFEQSKLRTLKKPRLTAVVIEKAVRLLK